MFTVYLSLLNSCTSADGLTVSTGLGGHCDWRLPKVTELASILPPSCTTNPCIDPTFGPTEGSMHTTATQVDGTNGIFQVSFFNIGSGIFQGVKDSFLLVRAVRGGL